MTTQPEDIAPLINHSPLPVAIQNGGQAQIDHLKERLLERDVTISEVWEYILLQHSTPPGMEMQPLALFVNEEMLNHFWSLHDWWAPVENKPANLPVPAIAQFCWGINYTPGTQPETFDDALLKAYHRCLLYCEQVGLDPATPGETAEQRARRKNRERMAIARSHRRVPDAKLTDEVKDNVRALESSIKELKAEAKEIDEKWGAYTKNLYDQMMAGSATRKQIASEYKSRIEAVRAEIQSLTAKQ